MNRKKGTRNSRYDMELLTSFHHRKHHRIRHHGHKVESFGRHGARCCFCPTGTNKIFYPLPVPVCQKRAKAYPETHGFIFCIVWILTTLPSPRLSGPIALRVDDHYKPFRSIQKYANRPLSLGTCWYIFTPTLITGLCSFLAFLLFHTEWIWSWEQVVEPSVDQVPMQAGDQSYWN